MSDQENPDGSPRPKRSRLSRPFQVLSLPTNSRGRKNAKNALTQPQLTQVVLEDVGDNFQNVTNNSVCFHQQPATNTFTICFISEHCRRYKEVAAY